MDIPGQRQMAGDGCRSQRSQILKKPPNHCLKVECLLQMGSHFFCQLIACFGNHMTLEDLNFPFFQQVFMTISHWRITQTTLFGLLIDIVNHKPNFGGRDQYCLHVTNVFPLYTRKRKTGYSCQSCWDWESIWDSASGERHLCNGNSQVLEQIHIGVYVGDVYPWDIDGTLCLCFSLSLPLT